MSVLDYTKLAGVVRPVSYTSTLPYISPALQPVADALEHTLYGAERRLARVPSIFKPKPAGIRVGPVSSGAENVGFPVAFVEGLDPSKIYWRRMPDVSGWNKEHVARRQVSDWKLRNHPDFARIHRIGHNENGAPFTIAEFLKDEGNHVPMPHPNVEPYLGKGWSIHDLKPSNVINGKIVDYTLWNTEDEDLLRHFEQLAAKRSGLLKPKRMSPAHLTFAAQQRFLQNGFNLPGQTPEALLGLKRSADPARVLGQWSY